MTLGWFFRGSVSGSGVVVSGKMWLSFDVPVIVRSICVCFLSFSFFECLHLLSFRENLSSVLSFPFTFVSGNFCLCLFSCSVDFHDNFSLLDNFLFWCSFHCCCVLHSCLFFMFFLSFDFFSFSPDSFWFFFSFCFVSCVLFFVLSFFLLSFSL